ncbi:MAG: hypothetical protein GXZ07_11405 [Firmicutes bacterium]|nr:hypothetical protein [Bacillota bacterium]
MKRVKVLLAICIFLLLVPAPFALADSEQDIKVFVNRKQLDLSIQPQFFDGRLMVPTRPFLEALGADISWDNKTNEVTVQRAGKTVVLGLEHPSKEEAGEKTRADVPLQVYKGTVMIPIDFAAKFLELDIKWNKEQNIVEVESPNFVFVERYSDKIGWPEWVESSIDHLNIQFRIKDNKLYLLSTFGEKTSGGYDVRISRITRREGSLIAEIDYKDSTSLPTIQVITKPFDLVYVELDTLSSPRPSNLIFKVRGLKDIKTLPVRAELPVQDY